ncbi:hypothetical protein [Pseudomonas putida]
MNSPQFEVIESQITRQRREKFSHRKETTGKYAEVLLILEKFAQYSGVKKGDVWREVLPALVDAALKNGFLDICVDDEKQIRRLNFAYDDVDKFLADARNWDFGDTEADASNKESKEAGEAVVAVEKAEEPEAEDKTKVGLADIDLNLDFSEEKK